MRSLSTMLMFALLFFIQGLGFSADKIVLQAAVQDHPHIRALLDGRIGVDGCELHLSTHSRAALHADFNETSKWDVIEVSFLPYLAKASTTKDSEWILIPVFPAREFQFRHIYIRTDRGIKGFEGLRGKTIGVEGYGETTPTWLRGTLQLKNSIKPEEITWLDTKATTDSVASLSKWLASGKVDAVFSQTPLQAYEDKQPNVGRLFEDYASVEQERFKENRVFPILTALAVKKSLIEKNPWLSESLFLAFSKAKTKSYSDRTSPLPWGDAQEKKTYDIMGKNFWSYGVKSNPKTLGAIFSFANSQNLLARKLGIDDVFDTATLQLIEP